MGKYKNKQGKVVPRTTTILSRFKESGGLIYWSWNIAFEGLLEARALLEAIDVDSKKVEQWNEWAARYRAFMALPDENWNYRHVRDRAADIGTIAHEMVECHIRGKEFDETPHAKDRLEKARTAFGAFLKWAKGSKLKPSETEISLVSEEYQYGGMMDATIIMIIDGELSLGDWKTGNALYSDHLIQISAYENLWNENNPDNPITGGYHLFRFDKENGGFTHKYLPQGTLAPAWESFKLMRRLYDLDKQLKKLIK